MESEIFKWLIQQTPAIVIAVWVIGKMFQMMIQLNKTREERDVRLAEELKGVAENLSSLSTVVNMWVNKIKGGGS